MSGGWKTVMVLLRSARKRARARALHQRKLMSQRRGGKPGTDWGLVGLAFAVLLTFGIHGMAGTLVTRARDAAVEVEAGKRGYFVISSFDLRRLRESEGGVSKKRDEVRRLEERVASLRLEVGDPAQTGNAADARRLKELSRQLEAAATALRSVEDRFNDILNRSVSYSLHGDARDQRRRETREHYERHGIAGFTTAEQLDAYQRQHGSSRLLRAMESLLIVLWFVMLAFQGEGMELDFQRRRHPMWEWLLSHPVSAGKVFTAEMLSPLAANPFFLSAPAFWLILYVMQYRTASAVGFGLAAGLPVALAACCFSKALEIAALVRLPARTRGAMLGILSWLGYASLFAMLLLINSPGLMESLARGLDTVVAHVPVPPVNEWLLGHGFGAPAMWKGVLFCTAASAAIIAGSVGFSAWASNRGLAGLSGSTPAAPSALGAVQSSRWLRDPLHRKELLWFWRDRGAVVQVILIPLTMAGFQAFQMRGLMTLMGPSWHVLCGLAVLLGSYFLFILGPRSLLSEGPALWIPLTWPRGLESLLKAKARLWWAISTLVVTAVLVVAGFLFPADLWRIALVAIGWFLFSGSLAEKTVTLVTVASGSGEAEPVPRGRRWAATLGTFTFAIGVLSQQWAMAFSGVVYSWITSAAMWQNLRARLPFLFDPWSEKLPPAPSLMHSMIAISAMMELMALVLAGVLGFGAREHLLLARSIAFAVLGTTAWIITSRWLIGRGVRARDIWSWSSFSSSYSSSNQLPTPAPAPTATSLPQVLTWTLAGAAVLGLFGWAWQLLLPWLPAIGADVQASLAHLADHHNQWAWLLAISVIVTPVMEEYFFRGLLYRALDREWGGWRAMAASALFFAIFHPPAAWLPEAALGLFNAFLFQRTRRLWPCVLVNAISHAIVLLAW